MDVGVDWIIKENRKKGTVVKMFVNGSWMRRLSGENG